MASKISDIKDQIYGLSKNELVEIVLKLASKKNNYEYLLINYLDKIGGEQSLYIEAVSDIDKLWGKDYNGRTPQHKAVKKLGACTKRLEAFVHNTNDKKLHANLMVYVLEVQFKQPTSIFGERFSGYDFKVGLLLKRLINLIETKMHPDYKLDYQDKINEFLQKLHSTSNHIKTILEMPLSVD